MPCSLSPKRQNSGGIQTTWQDITSSRPAVSLACSGPVEVGGVATLSGRTNDVGTNSDGNGAIETTVSSLPACKNQTVKLSCLKDENDKETEEDEDRRMDAEVLGQPSQRQNVAGSLSEMGVRRVCPFALSASLLPHVHPVCSSVDRLKSPGPVILTQFCDPTLPVFGALEQGLSRPDEKSTSTRVAV
ncbi:unnamed protein product [Protopolystoma xenopodis]|uniref:Uncharacterized protein n=1 Tax=Protopolystoma xenopodis TaxID=117903 RepID=A0A448WRR9_9PLAT|nr:unnamed protein product [Protopolystoma xenopodis]